MAEIVGGAKVRYPTIYATVRWSVKTSAGDDRHGDRRSRDEVDRQTERRPPARVGDELAAVLPQVLEPVPGEADDEQPRRCRDGRRRNDDEDRGHADLHS